MGTQETLHNHVLDLEKEKIRIVFKHVVEKSVK